MVGMTVLTFAMGIALAVATHMPVPDFVWEVALLALAIVGVFAPVLSLSMIPEYLQQPSKAYGVLDSMKSLAQAVLVLLIGKLREVGGLELATTFVFECFLVILVFAVGAAWTPPPSRVQSQ